jgi:hypothetical protein
MFSDSADQPSAHGGDRVWDVSFRPLDQRSAALPHRFPGMDVARPEHAREQNREESHSRVPSRQLIVRHARARSPGSLSGIESEVSQWPFFGARPDRFPAQRTCAADAQPERPRLHFSASALQAFSRRPKRATSIEKLGVDVGASGPGLVPSAVVS